MAQDTSPGYAEADPAYTQPQSGYAGSGNSGSRSLFIALGILVGIILAYLLFTLTIHSSSSSSVVSTLTIISQHKSTNATTIFMSPTQAETIFGSSLNRYTTTDLFNTSFIINASVFESLVPQLKNNITSGWVTLSNSSNANTYASLYYVVLTVNNPSHVAPLVGAATISPWFMYAMDLANTNYGSVNGLNYTYSQYTNSTAWAQAVYGWKGDHVILSLEYSNPGYLVNESALVSITAEDTP